METKGFNPWQRHLSRQHNFNQFFNLILIITYAVLVIYNISCEGTIAYNTHQR